MTNDSPILIAMDIGKSQISEAGPTYKNVD